MDDKLMYIPKYDTRKAPSVDYNQRLKRSDTQLNKSTNQNSIKNEKPTDKKTFYKTLGTRVINSSMSPPSLPVCK